MERLSGDEQAIEALRALAKAHKQFVKHLISEARTSSDHTATFQSDDGTKYALTLDLRSGQLEVRRA